MRGLRCFSFARSSNKFRALEVIQNKNHEYYLPIQGNADLNENSSNPWKFLYFCPPQKGIQWQKDLIKKLGRGCLFLFKISDKREENIKYCDYPVAPTLFLSNELCGQNGKGVKLQLQLELYLPASVWVDFPLKMSLYKTKWKEMENLNYSTITFPIYTFCFEYKKHRTTFVTYNIVSTDMNEKQFPEEFHTSLPSIDKGNEYDPFQQQDAPLCYKKENQNLQEEFRDSITKLGDDHLVEQMMVSWQDINEELERGSIQNYINVAAQWESIRDDWNKLNTFIKKKSLEDLELSEACRHSILPDKCPVEIWGWW